MKKSAVYKNGMTPNSISKLFWRESLYCQQQIFELTHESYLPIVILYLFTL